MNRKKIILIALIIILIIAGVIIYFAYFRKKKTEATISSQETKISKISDEKIYFPALTENNETIYYLKKNEDKGALAKYSFKTNKNDQISNTEVQYPFSVIWSPKKNQAIIQASKTKTPPKILHTSGILNYLFKTDSNKLKSLDPNIHEVVFSPDGTKIVYQYSDRVNKINNISVSYPDGSGQKKLFDVDYEDYGLFWTNQDYFLYCIQATDPGGNLFYKYDFKSGKTTEINNGERFTDIMSNSKKQSLIYEFYRDKKFFLGTMKTDGSDKKELNLEERIEKITILPGGDEIIAAIGNGENNSDKFYKVNLSNGEKTELIFQSQDKIQAFNLLAASNGKTVYFISNELLYKLEL
jgi:hypothetical protein